MKGSFAETHAEIGAFWFLAESAKSLQELILLGVINFHFFLASLIFLLLLLILICKDVSIFVRVGSQAHCLFGHHFCLDDQIIRREPFESS